MSQYRAKVMQDPLVRQAQQNELRRQRLEDRKVRVLHEKTRLLGIDIQALDQHARERQERERLEAERDMRCNETMNQHARYLQEAEAQRQKAQRQRNTEVWKFQQEQAREKQRNAMIADSVKDNYLEEETNFLRFRGEDLCRPERVTQQKLQQKDWLTQQIGETMQRESAERQAEADYEYYQRQVLATRNAAEDERNRNDRRANQEQMRYNQHLAVQKAAADRRDRMLNEDASQREVQAAMDSDLLNERVLNSQREGFKGYTKSQKRAVLDEQQRQIAALNAKRAQERANNAEDARNAEAVRREMVIRDRQAQAARTHKAVGVRNAQQAQKREKELRYDYLDNVVYTNPPTEGYFNQFGQSAR
jgi:hypothetical protein